MTKLVVNITFYLTMLIGVSSCYEFDSPNFSGGLGSAYGESDSIVYDYTEIDPSYQPGFFIDSLVQSSKSEVTIWAHILYDTTLVINSLASYTGFMDQAPREGYEIIKSKPDTIDFSRLADTTAVRKGRKEWIYQYNIEVDSLKSGVVYWFCTINRYTEFTKGIPILNRDDTCTDYFELK